MKRPLDELDIRILRLLQNDGTYSIKQIALNLLKSETTIFNRIKRLKNIKAILHTKATLNAKFLGFEMITHLHLNVVYRSEEQFEAFKKAIDNIKGIFHCVSITARNCNVMVKTLTTDTKALEKIRHTLTMMEGVTVVESYVLLEDIIPEKGFDV